jgi:hypothetical protein
MVEETPDKPKGRGKGKQSKIPTDIIGVLTYEGLYKVMDEFEVSARAFTSLPWATSLLDPTSVDLFDKACLELLKVYAGFVKARPHSIVGVVPEGDVQFQS